MVHMAAKRGPKVMTDEHKAALERGRAEGRVVRDYLEALRNSKPKRGRKRTPESIKSRLDKIDQELTDATAIEEEQRTLVEMVVRDVSIPVAVKLGPWLSSPGNHALEIAEAGAKGLVLVFGASRLREAKCETVELMRLVNTLCAVTELAEIRVAP